MVPHGAVSATEFRPVGRDYTPAAGASRAHDRLLVRRTGKDPVHRDRPTGRIQVGRDLTLRVLPGRCRAGYRSCKVAILFADIIVYHGSPLGVMTPALLMLAMLPLVVCRGDRSRCWVEPVDGAVQRRGEPHPAHAVRGDVGPFGDGELGELARRDVVAPKTVVVKSVIQTSSP